MSDQKIIAVIGATGAQGGGLARAILNDPSGGFRARAITRDPRSSAAQALAQQGAEVVAADIDDEAGLTQALQGAYGAYCVTFFWAHFSPEKEQAEIRNMARATKAAGVQHLSGWALGEPEFVEALQQRTPRRVSRGRPGWPARLPESE